MVGGSTDVEKQLPKAFGLTLQANLCATPNGQFDDATREAIRQAKIGANASRVQRNSPPLFRTINDEIKSTTEAQIFQDARSCSKDSSGTDRGYMTAFEKFRFVDDISIKDLQATLKRCDPNVAQTGVFDNATREGIAAAIARTQLPKSRLLNDQSYKMVGAVCI